MKSLKKSYWKGLAWFLLGRLVICTNNTLTKYLSTAGSDPTLHFAEVGFLRFVVATALLLVYAMATSTKLTSKISTKMHLFKGSMLAVGFFLWNHALTHQSITTSTIIGFTEPIFILFFSVLFLKEKTTLPLVGSTLVVFWGLFGKQAIQGSAIEWGLVILLVSAMIFALLDTTNKYHAAEPILSIIFYPSLVATLAMLPLACYHWTMPSWTQLGLLSLLGMGNNVMIYCMLKAYRHTSLVSLAPMRYIEVLFAILTDLVFFQESPSSEALLRVLFVIPSMLWVLYDEHQRTQQVEPSKPPNPSP